MVGETAMGISSVKHQRNLLGFFALLSSAACEWVLICFLLVDGALSYFIAKFAQYCELQAPCFLCSRLDHSLGNERREFYCNLLCCNHRLEISSLVSCHTHGELADVHELCEDCLLSPATKDKSNSESHKLLVGKPGFDLGYCAFQSSLPKDFIRDSSGMKKACSCCHKPWKPRANSQRLLPLKPSGIGVTKHEIPLPSSARRNHLDCRDSLKKSRDKFSGSAACKCLGNQLGIDSLSHVGYTELKITSDSDSEFPFSDDDDSSSIACEKNDSMEDFSVQSGHEMPHKKKSRDLASLKKTKQSHKPESSLLDLGVLSDSQKLLASDINNCHGWGELNWQHAVSKSNPSPLPELILQDNMPPSSSRMNEKQRKIRQHQIPRSLEFRPVVSEPVSANTLKIPLGSPEKDREEIFKLTKATASGLKIDQVVNGTDQSISCSTDPGDARRSAVSKRRKDASLFAEHLAAKDSDRDNKDLKPIFSQIPSVRTEEQLNISSPRVHLSPRLKSSPRVQVHGNETPSCDASNPKGSYLIQKPAPIERNDQCGYEFMEDYEIEGESSVDRLKRQIDYDRKCMNALYEELEKERSAAAIAANQALAMITRLQEEKAALHMEALQFLRMMEEEAEYDVKALEKANDILAEKDKEIQDLEAELEFFRDKYPVELEENFLEETCDMNKESMEEKNMGVHFVQTNAAKPEGHDEPAIAKNSSTSIELEEELEICTSNCWEENREEASSNF